MSREILIDFYQASVIINRTRLRSARFQKSFSSTANNLIDSENEHQFYERANVKTNGPKPYGLIRDESRALLEGEPDQKNVYKIIKKFENGVFSYKNNSYEVFQQFDTDKDGSLYFINEVLLAEMTW